MRALPPLPVALTLHAGLVGLVRPFPHPFKSAEIEDFPLSPQPFGLLAHRLHLFTGKGGVGKSSLVAALGLEAAQMGAKPLIIELGHRATMSAIFGKQVDGVKPREVAPGVHAVNLEFESSLQAYFLEHVPVKRLAQTISSNQTLGRFFRAAPAVTEIAVLNRLRGFFDEMQGSEPRFGPILVDLDATGHALMLFNLPKVLDGLVGQGPLRKLVDRFSQLLCDRHSTNLHLVTMARELPVQETCELYRKLIAEHNLALGSLFVNQMPVDPLETFHADEVLAADTWVAQAAPALQNELILMRRLASRHASARKQLQRLQEQVNLNTIVLPQSHLAGETLLSELTALGKLAVAGGLA